MATQYKTTKIIFHLGVINNFSAKKMLKIYELRKKINNFTEFNFYYLKGAMKKMKNFHIKGEACPGKFELPELLPDNIDKLLIFDAGDVLVFRDLTELYNYDMKDNWALGTPEPDGISLLSHHYNITKYLNIGSILLNVKELKKNNFWDTYTKNRNLKLLNDDGISNWLMSELGNSLPENKKNQINYIVQLFNPVFIHQILDKWKDGSGLSIYRNLAKYYIHLAGIWNELCTLKQGYCY